MKKINIMIFLFLVCVIYPVDTTLSCTIGVVSAGASKTGRPFIWKNRDYSMSAREEIIYRKADKSNVGGSLVMYGETIDHMNIKLVSGGVNDKGFAIVNSTVVEDPFRTLANINHILQEVAIERCKTLGDFEALLDKWFNYYLFVICGNFAVIDAQGGAAIYEVWSNGTNWLSWKKYDANEAENGFVVRSNSHLTDGWVLREGGVAIRYERAHELFTELYENDALSPRNVLRKVGKDVAGDCDKFAEDCEACYKYDKDYKNGDPDPNSFNTESTISRSSTTSSYVIDGAASDIDIPFITLYCALGEPSFTPAVPYFLFSEKVPFYAKAGSIDLFGIVYDLGIGCFLNKASMKVLSTNNLYTNNGVALEFIDQTIDYENLLDVQSWVFPLEDFVFDETESFMGYLRDHPEEVTSDILYKFSYACARYTYKNYLHQSLDYCPWDYVAPWE
ncbi:MAG: hypothetical protein KJ737_27410 [Proteobacteria bacterium]|nr:hypothetical protein [Pseudomonadota bacterium]